jgi:acetyl esterase
MSEESQERSPLDPELRTIVDLVAAVDQVPPTDATVGEMREAFAGFLAMLGAGDPSVAVEDVTLPGPGGEITLRCYRPPGGGEDPAGALVWFHGGGWVIGDLDTHDGVCRDLCAASGTVVVSVDYRRAPENRFPAAHDDAMAAVRWLLADGAELGIDPRGWPWEATPRAGTSRP